MITGKVRRRTIIGVLSAAAVALAGIGYATVGPAGDARATEVAGKSTVENTAKTTGETAAAQESVEGIDVASHQGNVDWQAQWDAGKRFAYVKATEGTGYENPYFAQQYNGSYDIGMIRGAYHFALPDASSGAEQAEYFVENGGGWSADGKTLPGALDIEYNPYGSTCYGLSQGAMVDWIADFTSTYKELTGRDPMIYTTTDWWSTCTGNSAEFSENPLWVARYSDSVGELPASWSFHTIWQYSSDPIDQNQFNGSMDRLQAMADG